jgi:hypothetical protein
VRRALFAFVLTAALPFCHDALAGDSVLAESLFRQGRTLMEKGDFAAACPRLSESYVQDPSTGTLLALAFCQEHLGQTASAWASYAEVVTRSKREGNADREHAARERADALEVKLSRLTIQVGADVAATPGLVVTRDGVTVGSGAWGTPTPLDPGEHTVGATAPGKEPWSVTVSIGKELDSQTVTVPTFASAPEPVVAPASTPADSAPAKAGSFFNGSPLQIGGIITAGVGVIGLGASLVFGLRAASLNDDSNADGHCTAATGCDAYGYETRSDAASAADTATILLLAGAGLTATGATLFIVGSSKPSAESARVEAAPIVAPGLAAMSFRGQF